MLKPFIGFAFGLGHYDQMPNDCHLAAFEAKFDANLLLLHISHFSTSVQSQISTNMKSRKMHRNNTHDHTAQRRLAVWFTKGTARNM